MHVGHVVVHGENFFEVGFVRENVHHPGEDMGVEDPRSALQPSSVFMEPNNLAIVLVALDCRLHFGDDGLCFLQIAGLL